MACSESSWRETWLELSVKRVQLAVVLCVWGGCRTRIATMVVVLDARLPRPRSSPACESRSFNRRRGCRTFCRLARDYRRPVYRLLLAARRRGSLHSVLLVGRMASLLEGCCCSARRRSYLAVYWRLGMVRLCCGRRDYLLFRAVEGSTLTPCCGCETVMRWWLGICAEMPWMKEERGSAKFAAHTEIMHCTRKRLGGRGVVDGEVAG